MEKIRNFSIIAHIDHGKSTLADRILEKTGVVSEREMVDQLLDDMELERERGITIKSRTVRIPYVSKDGENYILNLIDTPGHVDFTYEVSRSLAACEGALLVVDAIQGVQAQTLANAYLAVNEGLEIVPVINKIDLPSSNPDKIREEIEEVIGIPAENAVLTSAKKGIGIEELLEAIITYIPPPKGEINAPLRALIIDSWYDSYRGVGCLIRVFEGEIKTGDKIKLFSTQKEYEVDEVGVFTPKPSKVTKLAAGEVGYFFAGIKEIANARVGDTVTHAIKPAKEPLPGFREIKPMVFAGLFPINSDDYQQLRDAVEKLKLNDAAFSFEPENSNALGFGFRCGFLGLLHLDIVKSRLEREFGIPLIVTAPGVRYRVHTKKKDIIEIDNPSKLPPANDILFMEEPYINATIISKAEYVGAIITLCQKRRGVQKSIYYPDKERAVLEYELPLAEIVFDFYDELKSISRGYASLDYEIAGYKRSSLVKLDILVNGKPVDALSVIVHKEKAYQKGRQLVEKMKEIIPRQLFEVAIQAAIGSRVIARETIKPLRKNVLAKCYGGDVTRKKKLLEKQKEGKKRMKMVGKVEIPQEAFLAILKVKDK